MIMHRDTTTSAGRPLMLGTFLLEMGIEGTVDPTIASRGSGMGMDIMRLIQARETLAEGMKKEVKAGARYLKMTNPIDGMLGGSPNKIMSSTGSGVASSGEETRI